MSDKPVTNSDLGFYNAILISQMYLVIGLCTDHFLYGVSFELLWVVGAVLIKVLD